MSDFQIDVKNGRDLVFVAGKLQLVKDATARAQRIDIALHHFYGEWYRDQTQGTDWFGKILGKTSELSRRAEIRRRILSVPGVVEIEAMNLTTDAHSRKMNGTITVLDITGAPDDVRVSEVP